MWKDVTFRSRPWKCNDNLLYIVLYIYMEEKKRKTRVDIFCPKWIQAISVLNVLRELVKRVTLIASTHHLY
jgi:hypothetical protein